MGHKIEFYQYRPLNSDQSFSRLIDALNQKIYLTPLDAFNDPFERAFKLRGHAPALVLKQPKLFQEKFKFHKSFEPNLTENEFRQRLESEEFNEALEKYSQNLIKDFFKGHGAICLTRTHSNIPMWGHYGNNHRGYCLIFEVDFSEIVRRTGLSPNDVEDYRNQLLLENELISFHDDIHEFVFTKVRYEEIPPTIDLDEISKIPNKYEQVRYLVKNSIAVKYKQWEYEKEFRLIGNQNSKAGGLVDLRGYAPFLKIIGVIMEDKLDNNEKGIFKDQCVKRRINLYQAKISEQAYAIEVNEVVKFEKVFA